MSPRGYLHTLVAMLFVWLLATKVSQADVSRGQSDTVGYDKAQELLQRHCLMCHSSSRAIPAYPHAPAGVALDTPEQLARFMPRVIALTMDTRAMPPGNITGMTDQEREALVETLSANHGKVPQVEMSSLAADAYIWGYPLIYNMEQFQRFLDGGAPRFPDAAFNQFSHAREITDADEEFVSPNVDVLFSIAFCYLDNGPLRLSTPDTDGHYYVLQFLDPWTNNFAYVGRRATGTEAGEYLIVPTGYTGPVPENVHVITAPDNLFAIIARVAVEDEHDLSTPHAIQDGFVLQALESSTLGTGGTHVIPQANPDVPEELKFWDQLRVLLAAYPPPKAERDWVESLAPLGLLDTKSPYVDPAPALAVILQQSQLEAQQQLERDIKSSIPTVNGWTSIVHLFDYNSDYFEIGTIDSERWTIADRKLAHHRRAMAARVGLWANHGYEAAFYLAWIDGDGEQLNGAHRYEWALPQPPPAKAFWSLTMYQMPEFYLVENPLDRYAISSINKGVQYNEDGSLTLYLQTENPGPEKESNWLPTPRGDFRPALSIYDPDPAAFKSDYRLPPIRRIE